MRRIVAPLSILALLLPIVLMAAPAKPAARGKAAPRSTTKSTTKASTKSTLKTPVLNEGRKTPLQAMLAAELAFAQDAGTKSAREAFLDNLSANAVLFRPLPVNGLEYMQGRPPSQGALLWEPGFAEMAASGDFGITSGPSEYHPPAEADSVPAEISYGTFLSVWRHDPGKDWKVVLDCGISHPKPEAGVGSTTLVPGPVHEPGEATEKMEAGVLRQFDQALSTMTWSFNPARAVTYWTTADLRYLREGDLPHVADDARNAMSALSKRTAWSPIDCGIADSADLGFTYGVRVDSSEVAGQAPDSTVYVHVWRRLPKNQWRISAAVDRPLHHK